MPRLHVIASMLASGLAACTVAVTDEVAFSRAPAQLSTASKARIATLAAPRAVRVTRQTTGSVTLRWARTPGASSYLVTRNGRAVARVRGTRYIDRGLAQATAFDYRITAVDDDRATSSPSVFAPATTRAGGACTLHVSPDGDDSAPGTADRPLRTVGRLFVQVGPGDVGCLHGRLREDAALHRSGTTAAPIVIRSADGTRATLTGRLWIADDANHVVVQGLNLDGRNVTGDDLPSPTIQGDGVRFLDNDVTNRQSAICFIVGSIRGYGQARGVVLDGNRIHNCGELPANNHHHGVYIEHAYRTRITNNVIWGNADRGIQLYPNARASTIARNVLDGNGEGVIFSGNEGYASSGNRVTDNVITNSQLRYNIEYWWPDGNPIGRRNYALRNCLFNGNDGNITDLQVGFVARDNIIANPQYRDRPASDFRPAASSACLPLLQGPAPLRPFAST